MSDLPEERDDAGDDEFYLVEAMIEPALEEFRRTYEKRIRSFDGEDGEAKRTPYVKAYEYGVAAIRRRLGEEEGAH
ncbi:MAG: hypothetical protein KDC38_08560 [Planctomycetes bacterium]|nr:hypothetical protein [Planctomycetota bacterium]